MPTPDLPPPPAQPLSPKELAAVALGKGPDRMGFARLYLRAEGRVNRRTFWTHGVLALMLAGLLVNTVFDIVGVSSDNFDRLVNLVLVWPLLAISAKRIHDMDHSGWWVLLHFVPAIGSLAMIAVLGTVPGTRGPNRFGPEPPPADPLLSSDH